MSFVRFVVAALVLCAALASPLRAATFTDLATFEAALNPGAYTETFNGLAGPLGISHDFSGGAYSYTASTSTLGLLILVNGTAYLTTAVDSNNFSGPVTFTFTSGNVTAVGGRFWIETLAGVPIGEGDSFRTFTLTFSDGTVLNIDSVGTSGFFGYTSTVALTSMTFDPGATHRFVGIDDLIVGTAAPTTTPVPSPAAMGFLPLFGVMALMRRRSSH